MCLIDVYILLLRIVKFLRKQLQDDFCDGLLFLQDTEPVRVLNPDIQ
jgi:hypothetical protein